MAIKPIKSQLLCSIIILIIVCVTPHFADSGCGDWNAYRDVKCFQIFENLQNYTEALHTCNERNSTLVTITSLEEQMFFENFLFKTRSILDNVWTGLKYVNNKYKWVNDFDVIYTNWAEGSPKNKTDYCVQIDSDELLIGKWSDIACSKRNLALCQKLPTITMQTLLNILVNTRNQLDNAINDLEKTKKQVNSLTVTNNQFDYFFSNKWANFKTFAENNARKALIYPYKTQPYVLRSDAIELCRQNNATLVDIESEEKQKLVESFLYGLDPCKEFQGYWIGGYITYGKYKWLNSFNDFKFNNWAANNPHSNEPYVHIFSQYGDANDGKWYSQVVTALRNVICEIHF